ncbi:MAG: dihydroorotate dehydrogenase B catalytic subunit [Gemmatimonadetes bacterium]|nr:dihydroorotate dehydrogenase B catalytic subunit [Gemmatimonadota bacterium]|tara:strand:- start:13038 stop:13952 length:915 start_codon:yes stop_codon:yes gene_type:complete
MDMTVDIGGGLRLRNPVLMASGTFGHGAEYQGLFDFAHIGGVVTKTITRHPRAGNPPPRTAETPSGMLNSIGLTNPGLEGFIAEKLPQLSDLPTARIVSIAGTSSEEFAEMAEALCEHGGFDAIELNISSPNMKDGGMLFGCREDSARDVTRAVKDVADLPVIVKLTPNVTDIVAIANAVEEGGADGVALINTLLGMAIDIESARPILGNVTGGLSGPAVKPVALALTWKVASAVGIPVVGMGGISNATDAIEFMIAGANAIQVGTATFVDPLAGPNTVDGIIDYCQRKEIVRVAQLTGSIALP